MTATPGSAVVFAYAEVGVRGLAALLECDVDVRLVVTHADDPDEIRWFSSVADFARRSGIEVVAPEDPDEPAVVERVRAARPDWLFSLYYRRLLGAALLDVPAGGAYNLHGSLLPHYRGRAPVNWAILRGETRTGVSLHRMTLRPDAGDVLDREAVSILLNDTALDVSRKIACAAEALVLRGVGNLQRGTVVARPQDLAAGSYFGRRRPEDGRIDWQRPAKQIHDLVRAVAPPYPGAFTDTTAGRLVLTGSHFRGLPAQAPCPRLYWRDGVCWADCRDGRRFEVLGMTLDGRPLDEAAFHATFASALVPT